MRARLIVLMLSVALGGCGGEEKSGKAGGAKDEPEPAAGPEKAAVEPPADAMRKAPPMKREKVVLTAAQRKAVRKQMATGSKAQKAEKWADAVTAYEAALKINPSHARAFSELSWVAFKAGDYQRAMEAARSSVTLAVSPNIEAASLYNEGRALEALGKNERARAIYTKSLRLRPNEIVSKRLVDLGGEPPVLTAPALPCAEPVSKTDLCECLARVVGEGDASCEAEGKTVEGLRVWVVSAGGRRDWYQHYYLVHESDARFEVVAELGSAAEDPYTIEELRIESFKAEEIAGKKVLKLRNSFSEHKDGDYIEDLLSKQLTICVLDSGKVTCPLAIPLERSFQARLPDDFEDDEDLIAEFKKTLGEAPPINRSHLLRVAIGKDGKAVIEIGRGKKTNELKRYVGAHRLW